MVLFFTRASGKPFRVAAAQKMDSQNQETARLISKCMTILKDYKAVIVFCVIPVVILGVVLTGLFKHPAPKSKYDAMGEKAVRLSLFPLPADFNWKNYIENYEDLRQAGIKTEEAAKQHWREIGAREGRSYRKTVVDVVELLPSDFDWRTYVESYKDLQVMGIDTKEKAAKHWLAIGRKEGRKYKDDPLTVADIPYMPWKGES
jgi:hypothetical protein